MRFVLGLIFTTVILTLSSCATVVEGENKKLSSKEVEKVSFSIVSARTSTGDLSLVGGNQTCSIKWTVARGILTHRMKCKTETEDELWAYLLGMATRLRTENRRNIYFVRYTSKDFPKEEAYLGKVFSKSQMWRKLNKQNVKTKKYQKFSNKFLAKVIEKKGVLSLVPRALNMVGYHFGIDRVEITGFKIQRNRVLRPVGSRIVFKKIKANSNKNL